MKQVSKIYYINLDKSADRKEFMENHLSDIDIPYERFSGIEVEEEDLQGKYESFYNRFALRDEKNFMRTENPRKTMLGYLGNYLAHYFVQKKAFESDHGNYLVLEDDWSVNNECIDEIEKVFKQGLVNWDWDIFGSFWSSHKDIVIKHTGIAGRSRFHNNRHCAPLGGTHFMLYNKRSTQKIINFLDCEYVASIDGVLKNDMLNIYHKKMPIQQGGFKSCIREMKDEFKK
jgi:GR25 family glycosyltransferase involved in LPS biosynthesis